MITSSPHPTAPQTASHEGITLVDLLVTVWRGKFLIIATTVLFLVPAIILSRMEKPLFQSTSKFICRTSGQSGGGQLDLVAKLTGLRADAGSGGDPSAYFGEILLDEDFLSDFTGRKWEFKGDSLDLAAIWKMKPDQTLPNWERVWRKEVVSVMRSPKRINLAKNRTNGVFILDTYFESPELAQAVNQHLIVRFNEYIREDLLSNSRNKREFIEERLKEVEVELARVEATLVAFMERNKDVAAPKIFSEMERLRRTKSITQEIFLQLKKEYELAKIDELKDLPLLEIISKPTVPVVKSKSRWKLLLPGVGILGFMTGLMMVLVFRFVPWEKLRRELGNPRPAN